MIEKLTPEQEAVLETVKNEYVDRLLKPKGKINREKAIEDVKWLYTFAGLEPPEHVFFATSPQHAQIIANYVNEENDLTKIYDIPAKKMRSMIKNMTYFNFSFYGNVSDYTWVAFYDFFTRIGELKDENFDRYCSMMKNNIYDMIQCDVCCIVVEMPKSIRLNNLGALHATKFPAISWDDGYAQYYLNGVYFEKELWDRVVSEKMPFDEVMKLDNIEQRTQAMRFTDPLKFFKHVNAECLDTYEKKMPNGKDVINYHLMKIPAGDVFTTDAYYLYYDCPSTQKEYYSGVEPAKTVAEAMAWKFQITEDEWKELEPLVTES